MLNSPGMDRQRPAGEVAVAQALGVLDENFERLADVTHGEHHDDDAEDQGEPDDGEQQIRAPRGLRREIGPRRGDLLGLDATEQRDVRQELVDRAPRVARRDAARRRRGRGPTKRWASA